MNDDDLTPRQRQILAFIIERSRASGAPPTRVEIAAAFGFRSANAAEEHLRALTRKGAIEMSPGRSRGIRVLNLADNLTNAPGPRRDAGMRLPLVGQVAAGRPILAQEHVEAQISIDPSLFQPRADYLLRVRGDSMCGIGILDGDLLAVHRTSNAENGCIVVARIGDEVTVKRLELRGEQIRLLAENPDYAPIHVDPERADFCIEGVAAGVIRRW